MLFLAYQTGALHILESFVSKRIFSNKVKIKNTKKKFSRTDEYARTGTDMRFSQKNLWFLTRILVALFVFGGKKSDFLANSIYEKMCLPDLGVLRKFFFTWNERTENR